MILQMLLHTHMFQFTHPGGVRRKIISAISFTLWVSIHAPGRGATLSWIVSSPSDLFQFTHPGGVRRLA